MTSAPTLVSRMPPGIFDDPTFGLRERFNLDLIPVDAINRWWAEITRQGIRDARSQASNMFQRTKKGARWYTVRSHIEHTLIELHGLRLYCWLLGDFEVARCWASGLGQAGAVVGSDYPYSDEERYGVLEPFETLGCACVWRALELGCSHADEMLALLRRYSAWPAQKLCHEWGWTAGRPQASADGLVPVSNAVRWWSITADLGPLEAQAHLVEELEVVDAPEGPHFHRDDLLLATRADRLDTLSRRVKDSMDYLINAECSYSEWAAAPDVLRHSLLESHRLDPEKGRQLIGWTSGYFPDTVAEVEKEIG